MRQSRWLVVVFAFAAGFVGTSAARPDEEVELQSPAPEAEQVFVRTYLFKIDKAAVTVTAAGATGKATQSVTADLEEEVEYVAVDKDRRRVTTARTTVVRQKLVTTTDGKENPADQQTGALQGQVITSTRSPGGAWTHKLKAAATAKEQLELDRRVGPEGDDALYPIGKIKVGKEWAVSAAALQPLFGGSVTGLDGRLALKREGDEKLNKEDCAVITSKGTVTGVAKDDGGELKVELELEGKTWRSLTTKIDVKDEVTGTIHMFGKVTRDGRTFEFDLKGPVTVSGTARLKL